jgi:hypothetical protein
MSFIDTYVLKCTNCDFIGDYTCLQGTTERKPNKVIHSYDCGKCGAMMKYGYKYMIDPKNRRKNILETYQNGCTFIKFGV